jgi:hypothetical protein
VCLARAEDVLALTLRRELADDERERRDADWRQATLDALEACRAALGERAFLAGLSAPKALPAAP